MASNDLRTVLLTSTVTFAAAAGPAHAGGTPQGEVYDLRVIALTGDAAPGLFAGTFTELDMPAINAEGRVVFAAYTDGTFVNSGIWSTRPEDPNALLNIMGDGLFPPGAPNGVRFDEFGGLNTVHPSIGDDGEINLWAPMSGYGGEMPVRGGYFTHDGGSLSSITQSGDAISGLAGATVVTPYNSYASSEGGLTGFKVALEAAGVTESNDEALVVEWFGGPQVIVREGASAPGLDDHTWAPRFEFANPQIGPNGLMTFPVRVDDGESLGSVDAVYQGYPGLFEPVLVAGDGIPGAGTFRSLGSYARFAVNTAGDVVFSGSFDDGDEFHRGVFRITGGGIETVARTGGAGPIGTYDDENPGFAFNGQPSIADDGTVAFRGVFAEPSADTDTAIIRQRPGQAAEVVIREGDQAFGYWAGVEFDDLELHFASPALDRTGRLYVKAAVRGPGINATNRFGLWSIETSGAINLIARGQQAITVADFDSRFVSEIGFWAGKSMAGGQRPSVNDRGDVAFRIGFTDGTEAIIHGHLPPFCPADRNDDGFITFDDLLIVLASFDQTGPVGSGGDADWDGDTDFDDLLLILSAFGNACTPV